LFGAVAPHKKAGFAWSDITNILNNAKRFALHSNALAVPRFSSLVSCLLAFARRTGRLA